MDIFFLRFKIFLKLSYQFGLMLHKLNYVEEFTCVQTLCLLLYKYMYFDHTNLTPAE